MTNKRSVKWILASTLGLLVGIPAGVAIGAPLELIVGMMIITPLMLGLIGLFVGASQSFALDRRLTGKAKWVGLTVLGFAVGFTIALVLVEQAGIWITGSPLRMSSAGPVDLALAFVALGLIGGGVVGASQSWAMRDVHGAGLRWTASSALGLTAGFLAGLAGALLFGGMSNPVGGIVFLAVSALVYSAWTGRALLRISQAAPAQS